MALPIDPQSIEAIGLTLELAGLTTIVLLILATPLSWWLSQTRSWWRAPISALATLPLVLPPTVLGFYLLVVMGPNGPLGRFTLAMGWGIWSFTFTHTYTYASTPRLAHPHQHVHTCTPAPTNTYDDRDKETHTQTRWLLFGVEQRLPHHHTRPRAINCGHTGRTGWPLAARAQ